MDDFLNRAASSAGLRRVRYDSQKQTTDPYNSIVLPLFCDRRYLYVASTLLGGLLREKRYGSRYFIIATYPGMADIFPFADEVWEPSRPGSASPILNQVEGFGENSPHVNSLIRSLNRFMETIDPSDLREFYDDGIKRKFLEDFGPLERSLPDVPSAMLLGENIARKIKSSQQSVAVIPSKYGFTWERGKSRKLVVSSAFYNSWVERLLKEGYNPIIIQFPECHDISGNHENLLYFKEPIAKEALAVLRSAGILVDFFGDVKFMGYLARCGVVSFEERSRFSRLREFELIQSTVPDLPKEYCYNFSYTVETGESQSWNNNFFDLAIRRIKKIEKRIFRDEFPPATQLREEIDYRRIVREKIRKLGTRLIQIPLD